VIILSTVLDETWRGRTGLDFVDDPQLVNVAVSRAIQRFILVTNYDMLPASRHIRDLIGYRLPAAGNTGEFGRHWTTPKPTGLSCQPGNLLTGPSRPGRRLCPAYRSRRRHGRPTGEPNLEDRLSTMFPRLVL
jgi:hypothetical protein